MAPRPRRAAARRRAVAAPPSGCDTLDVTSKRPPRPATRADLDALPEHVVGEIIAGVLYMSPRPAAPHALAASVLGHDVVDAFHGRGRHGGPGGWWILAEPELHLGDDVVIPDVAGWRRERMPSIPDVAAFTLVPDWLCEVASPSTMRLDRAHKMAVYARAGVKHLWIVDPLARTLEVFALHDGRWLLLAVHADDAKVRAAPFDAVELESASWWDRGEG